MELLFLEIHSLQACAGFISNRGFEFVTTNISKYKTALQLTLIILTLIFLTFEGLSIVELTPTLNLIRHYNIIYILTLLTAIFTAYTGVVYLYTNRIIIKEFMKNSLMNKVSEIISTVFYIGRLPFAPGTWCSFAAFLAMVFFFAFILKEYLFFMLV